LASAVSHHCVFYQSGCQLIYLYLSHSFTHRANIEHR
jgi:hypothetical protein